MKNVIFTLICIFPALGIAQQNQYSFQMSTGSYEALQNPVLLSGSDPWLGADWFLQLAFEFEFLGESTNSILFEEDLVVFDDDGERYMTAFGPFLQDRCLNNSPCVESLSPVGYLTTGSVGERITKVEFNNAGLSFGTAQDFVNFQIWLYEEDFAIEFHIGPNLVSPAAYQTLGYSGAVFGLTDEANNDYRYLAGTAANPTLEGYSDENYDSLEGVPSAGTIYRFYPGEPTATSKRPAPNKLRTWFDGYAIQYALAVDEVATDVRVIDQQGRSVAYQTGPLPRQGNLPASRLRSGIYYVQFRQNHNLYTEKLVIKIP